MTTKTFSVPEVPSWFQDASGCPCRGHRTGQQGCALPATLKDTRLSGHAGCQRCRDVRPLPGAVKWGQGPDRSALQSLVFPTFSGTPGQSLASGNLPFPAVNAEALLPSPGHLGLLLPSEWGGVGHTAQRCFRFCEEQPCGQER